MKTSIHSKNVIRYILLYTSLALLICSQVLSQSSDKTNSKNNITRQNNNNVRENTNDDIIKKKSGSEEEVIKILKKGNKFGKVNDSEDVETPIISLSSKSIDATIVKGNILTYPITIENSGSSVLKWEITVQGISGVSYRLNKYPRVEDIIVESKSIKDQNKNIVSRLDAKGKQNNKFVQKSEVKKGKKFDIEQKENSMEKNNVKEFYLTLQEKNTKKIGPVDDSQLISTKVSSTEKKTFDRIEPEIFQRYYHFAECGYPTFEPHEDVVEISTDNGRHWKQILQFGDQSYVVDAKCFNPHEFLETYNKKTKNLRGSKLTSLEEYLAEVQKKSNWLSIQPSSGKIPADTLIEIEVSFKTAGLEVGSFNPNIILKTKGSKILEINIPVHLTVVSSMEEMDNSQSNHLSNQLEDEQIGDESKQIPDEYALSQNYPNPFNPSTTIKFSIPNAGFVTLVVYDVLGSEVATLVNEEKIAGYFEMEFNASFLASGIYFYRIQAGDFVESKKMVLMK